MMGLELFVMAIASSCFASVVLLMGKAEMNNIKKETMNVTYFLIFPPLHMVSQGLPLSSTKILKLSNVGYRDRRTIRRARRNRFGERISSTPRHRCLSTRKSISWRTAIDFSAKHITGHCKSTRSCLFATGRKPLLPAARCSRKDRSTDLQYSPGQGLLSPSAWTRILGTDSAWEHRAKAAQLLASRSQLGVPDALLEACKQDKHLEVVKIAISSFSTLTGHRHDVLECDDYEKWWSENKPRIDKNLKPLDTK